MTRYGWQSPAFRADRVLRIVGSIVVSDSIRATTIIASYGGRPVVMVAYRTMNTGSTVWGLREMLTSGGKVITIRGIIIAIPIPLTRVQRVRLA